MPVEYKYDPAGKLESGTGDHVERFAIKDVC